MNPRLRIIEQSAEFPVDADGLRLREGKVVRLKRAALGPHGNHQGWISADLSCRYGENFGKVETKFHVLLLFVVSESSYVAFAARAEPYGSAIFLAAAIFRTEKCGENPPHQGKKPS
jgi:hypothetical protein